MMYTLKRTFSTARYCVLLIVMSKICLFSANSLLAEEQSSEFQIYGPGIVFNDEPNIFYLIGDIRQGDYFEVRRYLRQHSAEYFLLASPGGNIWEALQISGMVHDLGISTIVPSGSVCASACSLIYFAGQPRLAAGWLGVHQFYTEGREVSESAAQFTVSEIISFLNEYSTPSFVFEHMFRNEDTYFLSDSELEATSTTTPARIDLDLANAENRIQQILTAFAAEHTEQPSEISPDTTTPQDSGASETATNIIFGPPPIMPQPRPLVEFVHIQDQSSLDRLRILISRANGSYEQPTRSFFRGGFPIPPNLRDQLMSYISSNLPGFNISLETFIDDLTMLIYDDSLPLSAERSVDIRAVLGYRPRRQEIHGSWVSGRSVINRVPHCFMLTTTATNADPNSLSAIPMVALGTSRGRDRSWLEFDIPFPDTLIDESMDLFIDGSQTEFEIKPTRYPFHNSSESTISPQSMGENLVSTEIVMRFSLGQSATITGINSMTGEETELSFSLNGFTAAFRRMVSLCDAPELLEWLP